MRNPSDSSTIANIVFVGYTTTPLTYRDIPNFLDRSSLRLIKRQKTSCVHPIFYPFYSSKLPAFLKSIRLRRNALCTTQHQMAERTDAAKCYKKNKRKKSKSKNNGNLIQQKGLYEEGWSPLATTKLPVACRWNHV